MWFHSGTSSWILYVSRYWSTSQKVSFVLHPLELNLMSRQSCRDPSLTAPPSVWKPVFPVEVLETVCWLLTARSHVPRELYGVLLPDRTLARCVFRPFHSSPPFFSLEFAQTLKWGHPSSVGAWSKLLYLLLGGKVPFGFYLAGWWKQIFIALSSPPLSVFFPAAVNVAACFSLHVLRIVSYLKYETLEQQNCKIVKKNKKKQPV